MATTSHAAGVVLAAGAGTRFGMPKVLAAEGRWLQAAITALYGGGCGEVVVVLGAAIVEVAPPARAVVATDWQVGLSASLRAGITALGDGVDYAVIHTVDTPDIGAEVIRRVLTAARTAPSGLARAQYAGRPGHPVALGRRHWPALLGRLRGDEGAKPFLRGRRDVVHIDCVDLATGRDIDTATSEGSAP